MTLKEYLKAAELGLYKNDPEFAFEMAMATIPIITELAMAKARFKDKPNHLVDWVVKKFDLSTKDMESIMKYLDPEFIAQLMSIPVERKRQSLTDCLLDESMKVTSADFPRLYSN